MLVEIPEVNGIGVAQELRQRGGKGKSSGDAADVASDARWQRSVGRWSAESLCQFEIAAELLGELGNFQESGQGAGNGVEGLGHTGGSSECPRGGIYTTRMLNKVNGENRDRGVPLISHRARGRDGSSEEAASMESLGWERNALRRAISACSIK
jgi:hypothetical protein